MTMPKWTLALVIVALAAVLVGLAGLVGVAYLSKHGRTDAAGASAGVANAAGGRQSAGSDAMSSDGTVPGGPGGTRSADGPRGSGRPGDMISATGSPSARTGAAGATRGTSSTGGEDGGTSAGGAPGGSVSKSAPSDATSSLTPSDTPGAMPGPAPQVDTIILPEGVAVTTIKRAGQQAVTATFAGDGSEGASSADLLSTARRLKTMPLADYQRNSIDVYSQQFDQTMKTRLDEARTAVRSAFAQVLAAKGDQAVAAAQQRLQEASRQQATLLSDLNKEYANGAKAYLTAAQAAELDKAAQAPAPAAGGSAVIQIGEGQGRK